jgi:hypothetical protein
MYTCITNFVRISIVDLFSVTKHVTGQPPHLGSSFCSLMQITHKTSNEGVNIYYYYYYYHYGFVRQHIS